MKHQDNSQTNHMKNFSCKRLFLILLHLNIILVFIIGLYFLVKNNFFIINKSKFEINCAQTFLCRLLHRCDLTSSMFIDFSKQNDIDIESLKNNNLNPNDEFISWIKENLHKMRYPLPLDKRYVHIDDLETFTEDHDIYVKPNFEQMGSVLEVYIPLIYSKQITIGILYKENIDGNNVYSCMIETCTITDIPQNCILLPKVAK